MNLHIVWHNGHTHNFRIFQSLEVWGLQYFNLYCISWKFEGCNFQNTTLFWHQILCDQRLWLNEEWAIIQIDQINVNSTEQERKLLSIKYFFQRHHYQLLRAMNENETESMEVEVIFQMQRNACWEKCYSMTKHPIHVKRLQPSYFNI